MSEGPQVRVSARSLESLEFPEVLALVGALASTDVGRRHVLSLQPVCGERLEFRRAALIELEAVLGEGLLVETLDEPVLELLEELAASRPELSGRKLVRWSRVLTTARAAFDAIGEEHPCLYRIVGELPNLSWLGERIARTLDLRGEVRDDASPALAKLRRKIGRLRKATYEQLQGVLGEQAEAFSQDTIPFHNGRLMLMLRTGDRGRVDGFVHGSSASGRSLYFEPLAAVQGNNDLQQAVAAEEAERRRLLRELIDQLLAAREDVEANIVAMARLDALQAGWRFGETIDGRMVEISDGDLVLEDARHPLLTPQTRQLRDTVLGRPGHAGDVTPLDLALTGEDRVLLITGPNAGGKTVALKTCGLVVLLTLCGLPAPVAAGSRVPLVTSLVGVVGDEQDLMQDRSTFSGRLERLREAWLTAGPDSLVLLDELGSGTDPEEGAALSVALLERLVETATCSVLTTHLLAVASAAADTPGAVGASMEFDRATNSPTYRLIPGPPGGSEAIALARQLELPAEWLTRAEALVGEEHGQLRRLLAEVDATRADLEVERDALRRLRQQVAVERQSLAAERKTLEEERRKLGVKMKHELEAFRRRVRERMDDEVGHALREVARGRKRDVAVGAVRRLFDEAPESLTVGEAWEGAIDVGDRVRHVEYSWTGTVESLEGDRASVSVQGKRMQCTAAQLRPVAEPGGQPPRRPRVALIASDEHVPREIDLIGERVEAALTQLDRYLDRALLVPHVEVRVVHGHGTGRLRQGVREFLAGHAAVADLRAGRSHEGGEGVTVVRLAS